MVDIIRNEGHCIPIALEMLSGQMFLCANTTTRHGDFLKLSIDVASIIVGIHDLIVSTHRLLSYVLKK